jgi:hypothetical protein
MSYQEMRKEELDKALAKLYENYEKLLEAIGFDGFECICGRISNQITKFLEKNGIKANLMSGMYSGRGTEFSGGQSGTSHCWVELCLKLKDCPETKEVKIIIDGAYAQFFPHLTPRITRDKQRLMIFIDDKTAEEWYKGKIDTSW